MGPPGHFALGLAARPLAPRAPLWILLLASELPDLLSAVFLASGIERAGKTSVDLKQGIQFIELGSMPWSHGLIMNLVWSILSGALSIRFYRDPRTGLIIGLLVLSHWALDFVVHPPDLPLFLNNSPRVGLGLWGSGPGLIGAIMLELLMFGAGMAIYRRSRRSATVNS